MNTACPFWSYHQVHYRRTVESGYTLGEHFRAQLSTDQAKAGDVAGHPPIAEEAIANVCPVAGTESRYEAPQMHLPLQRMYESLKPVWMVVHPVGAAFACGT